MIDIEQIVAERLDVRGMSSGSSGEQIVCDCPFCDAERKLYVSAVNGRWICYRCDERGSLATLVAAVDEVPFAEAKKRVRDADLFDARTARGRIEKGVRKPFVGSRSVTLPEEFEPVFDGLRWRVPEYLARRGVSPKIAARFGLGFANSGRYAKRVVLPCYMTGELRFFQARAVDDREPRYLGPSGSRFGLLFGHDLIGTGRRIAVVEGAFDVIGCARAGVLAVGLFGKVADAGQILAIAKLDPSHVDVMLDPEAPREARKLCVALKEIGISSSVAKLDDGVDPGAATPEQIERALKRADA